MRNLKLPIILLIIILALGVGVTLRLHTVKPAPAARPATVRTTPALSDEQREQRRRTALDFERYWRDYGTDPGVVDAPDLHRLRMSSAIPDPKTLASLSSIDVARSGPLAASPECDEAPQSTVCAQTPTGWAHQRRSHYTLGARIDGTPTVTLTATGDAIVSGRSKLILWSGVNINTERMPDGDMWWHLTPSVETVAWTDRLSFADDGRVSDAVATSGPDSFWRADWGESATSWIDSPTVLDIPMEGAVPDVDAEGVRPDVGAPVSSSTPTRLSDQWDAIRMAHGAGDRSSSVQNPLAVQ